MNNEASPSDEPALRVVKTVLLEDFEDGLSPAARRIYEVVVPNVDGAEHVEIVDGVACAMKPGSKISDFAREGMGGWDLVAMVGMSHIGSLIRPWAEAESGSAGQRAVNDVGRSALQVAFDTAVRLGLVGHAVGGPAVIETLSTIDLTVRWCFRLPIYKTSLHMTGLLPIGAVAGAVMEFSGRIPSYELQVPVLSTTVFPNYGEGFPTRMKHIEDAE